MQSLKAGLSFLMSMHGDVERQSAAHAVAPVQLISAPPSTVKWHSSVSRSTALAQGSVGAGVSVAHALFAAAARVVAAAAKSAATKTLAELTAAGR